MAESYKLHSDANQSMFTDYLEAYDYKFGIAPDGVIVVEDENEDVTERALELGGELYRPKKRT